MDRLVEQDHPFQLQREAIFVGGDDMIDQTFKRQARVMTFLGLMFLIAGGKAWAYEIQYFGTSYGPRVTIDTAVESHWDSFTWNYQPDSQQMSCQNEGNSQANLGTQLFRIVPGAGETGSGQVGVAFGFATDELIQQAFTNFGPEVFDYHYAFGLRLLDNPIPQGDEPIISLPLTEGLVSYITLGVDVDKDVWFDLVLDVSEVHAAAPTFDTCLWQPQVTSISLPGSASTLIRGSISMTSIELVPEPCVGSMALIGLLLIRRHRTLKAYRS